MNKIKYISAPAGFGKSKGILEYLKKMENELTNKQAFIVLKTNAQADEWNINIENANINCPVFSVNSKNSNSPVLKTIREYLKTNHTGIVILSESAFNQLNTDGSIKNKENKIVFLDEYPNSDEIIKLNIPKTFNILEDNVNTTLSKDGKSYILTPRNEANIKQLIAANDDVIKELFSDLFRKILSPSFYEVKVNKANWDNCVNNKNTKTELNFLVTVKPAFFSNYNEFYMAGAFFEDKMLEKCYPTIKFEDVTEDFGLTKGQLHTNGHRLEIMYFSDRNWSLTFLNKIINDNLTNFDILADNLKEIIKGDALCYTNVNKQKTMSTNNIKTLSPCVIGLNNLQHYTTSIYLAAIVPSNEAISARENVLTREELITRDAKYTMYQALLRDSIRDRDADGKVTHIVPTLEDALYLASKFDEDNQPTISQIDLGLVYDTTIYDEEAYIKDFIKKHTRKMETAEKHPSMFTFISNKYNEAVFQTKMEFSEFAEFLEGHETKGSGHVINACFKKHYFRKDKKKLSKDFENLDCKLNYDNHKYSKHLMFDFDLENYNQQEKNEIRNYVIRCLDALECNYIVRESTTPGNFHIYVETEQNMDKELYKKIQEFFYFFVFQKFNDTATKSPVQKIHIDKGKTHIETHLNGEALDIIHLINTTEFKEFLVNSKINEKNKERVKETKNKDSKTNYKKAKECVDIFESRDNKHNSIFGLVTGLAFRAKMSAIEIQNYAFSSVMYFIGNNQRQQKLIEVINKILI